MFTAMGRSWPTGSRERNALTTSHGHCHPGQSKGFVRNLPGYSAALAEVEQEVGMLWS